MKVILNTEPGPKMTSRVGAGCLMPGRSGPKWGPYRPSLAVTAGEAGSPTVQGLQWRIRRIGVAEWQRTVAAYGGHRRPRSHADVPSIAWTASRESAQRGKGVSRGSTTAARAVDFSYRLANIAWAPRPPFVARRGGPHEGLLIFSDPHKTPKFIGGGKPPPSRRGRGGEFGSRLRGGGFGGGGGGGSGGGGETYPCLRGARAGMFCSRAGG